MRIVLVAGEASGDLLGGLLLDGLKARWPEAQFVGIGGAQMVSRGMQAWWPSDQLAVRGYVEVLKRYRELRSIRRALQERLIAEKPDLYIGIDAPDFNLDLETSLRAKGIKTVHFVSPSIWAWRFERIEKIRRAVDHMLCIFPHEKPIYDKAGVAATYVGHPLAAVIPMQPDRAAARAKLSLPTAARVVALLPGSRVDEIRYMAPLLFGAVALMKSESNAIEFIVPCIPHLMSMIVHHAEIAGVTGHVRLIQEQSHDVLAACDVAAVASGTATLEAALFKRPMVIGYAMPALSWWLMKRKALQAWVGLPNILCGAFVVPELIQEQCTSAGLAQAVLHWCTLLDKAPETIGQLESRFTLLHHELQRNTCKLATDAIEKVLQQTAH